MDLLVSCSVISNSLWPHGLQHAGLPCPSLSCGVCSDSYPLCWWCHPAISSAVTRFSSCLQSFPASGSFPMSWSFASGGQSIGASALASVLPMNIQGWFPLGLTGLISLHPKGFSRVFSSTIVQKHQFFSAQPSLWFNSHIHTCKSVSSVAQLCLTLFDPMDCRKPGFPAHHQLPELTQTHARWIGDAIQPSHPLLSPSPPALNLSQHQSLSQWVSSSHQVAKVLEFQLQHQSFQWIFRTDFL